MEAEQQPKSKTIDFKSHSFPIENFISHTSSEGHKLHTYRFPASDREGAQAPKATIVIL